MQYLYALVGLVGFLLMLPLLLIALIVDAVLGGGIETFEAAT